MNPVSSNSVALSLLTQSAPLNQKTSGSAADTILDIVSGRRTAGSQAADEIVSTAMKAKAAEKTETTGRAVGGTVSSELPRATTSAMSAATVNGLNYNDPSIAFTATKPSPENAEAFVRQITWSVEQYNRRFEPEKTVPPREEYNTRYAKWGADRIANGEDVEKVNREVAYFTSDKMYLKETKYAQFTNEWNMRASETGKAGIAAGAARLSEVFSQDLEITYDERGVAKMAALDLHYATGQKMLSYGNDGSLTIFNEDGSVKSSYASDDVAQI